jgi:hypothetical protein
MPSTYTNNSGIEKPGSGEQAGTWGATSNNNFDIIDRALNGVGVITLAGTSHTLTTTDGTLSDGQYKVLILAGTPSGTNTVTISPNDQDKIYFVRNTTAQSVVFTQGSGGNATIPSGETKIIYADGAGAGAAVSDFTGALSITGNVNATTLDINGTQVTATAAELNTLDGITATTAELNYTDGVTSLIQPQLNVLNAFKQNTITGAASTITSSNLTANRALLSNGSGKVAASANVTSTELGYLDGVTSNIQSQFNGISTELVNDTSPQLGGNLDGNGFNISLTNNNHIQLGNWYVYMDGAGNLKFQYSGNTVARIAPNGAITSENDVTAFGSV